MKNLFLPDKVSLGRILILEDKIPDFMDAILSAGAVHIEDKFDIFPVDLPYKYEFREELSRIELLESRIEAICRILDLSPARLREGGLYRFVEEISVIPSEISKRISSDLDRIEANITEVVTLIERRKQFIFETMQVSWFLSILLHSGLDYLGELNPELVSWWIGSLPRTNLPLLFESMEDIPAVIEWTHISRERVGIFLLSSPEYAKSISASLKAGNFLEVDLSNISKTEHISELIDDLEFALWEAREEISELNRLLREKKKTFQGLLSNLAKLLVLEKKLVTALAKSRSASSVVVFNFWVREEDKPHIEEVLRRGVEDLFFLEWVKEEEVPLEKKDIPANYSLPRQLVPFFELVRMYGYPGYDEVNPVAIVAIGFVLMYGMMFADVGHGLVLALLAWTMRRLAFGPVLLYSGISAMLWGWIFGSVFGREDLIRPLWVSPLEQPIKVMIFSIIVGIIYLNIGIALSVLRKVRLRAFKEAIFGEWGLTSALMYAGMLISLIPGIPLGARLVALGGSIGLFVFGNKVLGHGIEELLSGLMEAMIGLFSNTVSFVRLAAFAINHGALMIAVFVLASLLKWGHLDGLVLLFGNIGVIVLEAVLVAIQTLRLHFYEFFSKFYDGHGREFNPLRWEIT